MTKIIFLCNIRLVKIVTQNASELQLYQFCCNRSESLLRLFDSYMSINYCNRSMVCAPKSPTMHRDRILLVFLLTFHHCPYFEFKLNGTKHKCREIFKEVTEGITISVETFVSKLFNLSLSFRQIFEGSIDAWIVNFGVFCVLFARICTYGPSYPDPEAKLRI